MSLVTNIILHIGILEDEKEKIKEINKFFDGQSLVSVDDENLPRGWYGGSKMLECNLYIGAFNYLRIQEFIDHL